MAKILILEDNIEIANLLKEMLEYQNYDVAIEMAPAVVIDRVKRYQPDLILLDVSFGDKDDETGIELLRKIRERVTLAQLPVIVVSAFGNETNLTRMMDLGISGYIPKPVNQTDLLKKIKNRLEHPVENKPTVNWAPGLIGKSPAILELIEQLDMLARLESGLLVIGETGVGKERVFEYYRSRSPRRDKPYRVIFCPTLTETLFESEVFGYEKGAHNTARELKKGIIEEAEGGILVFDEIGNLPLDMQPKLLRLIEYKKFTRVGGTQEQTIDAVIIAATNKPLYQLMQEGKFMVDLYYRLNRVVINVPPLRDHLEDIPRLVEHFLKEFNQKYSRHVTLADPDLLKRLQKLRWDGNIRQLENSIEHGVLKCAGQKLRWEDLEDILAQPEHRNRTANGRELDFSLTYDAFRQSLDQEREDKEKAYYLFHLNQNHFNVSQTAMAIGVARTYLTAIMKRLGIQKPDTAEETEQ